MKLKPMKAILAATRKGKRGRGAVGKTAVFGLLKRDSKVYTVVIIFQLSIIELGFMYHE